MLNEGETCSSAGTEHNIFEVNGLDIFTTLTKASYGFYAGENCMNIRTPFDVVVCNVPTLMQFSPPLKTYDTWARNAWVSAINHPTMILMGVQTRAKSKFP